MRASAIAEDRATNYSVVRITLLEHLYEKLYDQRITTLDESQWRCRILTDRVIESAVEKDQCVSLHLTLPEELKRLSEIDGASIIDHVEEDLEVDYLFTATGYQRNTHESILASTADLLPSAEGPSDRPSFPVSRDYRIEFDQNKVDNSAGIWLQGCNEGTHGVSSFPPAHVIVVCIPWLNQDPSCYWEIDYQS